MEESNVSLIYKYFPSLSDTQRKQFALLQDVYAEWNEKINVISRKDIQNLYERHVLHSLGIARFIHFAPSSQILDVGTGGGFPGIPLAILFPESHFHLIDSIGKKITVVENVAKALELQNVSYEQARAEKIKNKYDFITARAVTDIKEFFAWVKTHCSPLQKNTLHNGILYLKGGNLHDEFAEFKYPYTMHDLGSHFEEEFFETKKVIHIPMKAQ